MTKEECARYKSVNELREVILKLDKKKFELDCGHHVTFGTDWGNDLSILNGKVPKIICSMCGH